MTPDAPAPANGTVYSASHLQLAALLRECANLVERNEFHPDMHQALGLFQAYTGQHSSGDEHRQVSTKASTTTTLDPIHDVMSSLGKGLKKGLGLEPHHNNKAVRVANPGAAKETSAKNAERARSDLGDLARKGERGNRSKNENDWCNEHFCLGCACKDHLKTSASSTTSSPTEQPSSVRSRSPVLDPSRVPAGRDTSRVNVTTTANATATATATPRPAKPSFQRPVNPNSILIANGWIEQQRRSKMRVVWKDVLASLVEGRKPGEETTLWIQRETTNQSTGKPELEALHQIPMKWLVSIEYLDYATDHRFALKVYNVPEEFLFKCADEESAQNWVLTLRSVREITLKNARVNNHAPKNEVEAWGETTTVPSGEQMDAPSREAEQGTHSHRMPIHELRAIAHGAGISTAGMERKELEAAVANIAGSAQSDAAKDNQRRDEELRRKQEMEVELRRRQAAAAAADAEEAEQRRRMTEESEKVRKIAEEEEHRIRLEQEHHRRQIAEEEQRRRQVAEEEQRHRKLVDEAQRRRQEAEVEMRRRKQAEEAQRIEEIRRRKLAEEEQQRRAAEEEQRRRAAEQQAAEQRRREEAQRQQWQQQQRQQAAEQQAGEQRRRQEEAQRQQQWQQQQQRQQQQQQWHQRKPPPQQPPPQNWQNPPQQPFYGGAGGARAASPSGQAPPPPQRGQGPTSSPVNLKYAKMAAQNDDGGQATMTAIKHNILVHWALQPPRLQMLRPIDVLISTIHTVFPPVFGVAGHDYFSNWQAVKREDLVGQGNMPEEEKLKKGVKKLRFFLHPDKLPRDLTDEQTFMCKMLWDISSDAWDDFQKHKEELDWVRN